MSEDEKIEDVGAEVPSSDDLPAEEVALGATYTTAAKRNLNCYYGHKIGFLQSLSLLLNAGLMIYAHVGLSAVIFSSRDPSITSITSNDVDTTNVANDNSIDAVSNGTASSNGKCNEEDLEIWISTGGEVNRPVHSNFCSRTYNGGCFINSDCIETCFQENYGYSAECSTCFGVIPQCSMNNGCTWLCAADSFGAECQECNIPCVEQLNVCTGLPEVDDANATKSSGTNATDNNVTPPAIASGTIDGCNSYALESIDEWYNAYNLTFVKSVNDAWNGDEKLLAVIVVLFSGIWPYAKNIILLIVWYLPMSENVQTSTILWLSRLSKYTLVDVFAVIGVLVGVQLQLNIGGTEAVIRAEPRFGIIAFFLATVWEFIQIELIKAMHERKIVGKAQQTTEEKLYFERLWIPVAIFFASIALYLAGAATQLVYFTSFDIENGSSCEKSYNAVTLANALVGDLSLTDNSAPGQTWILFLIYIMLILALPAITHLFQFLFLLGWFRSKRLRSLIKWTTAIWCFACVEVLLIGIFAVEYKFPNLIMKIAGEANAGFLDIESGLGPGFYILIVYSVVAGFLQFSLRVRYHNSSKPAVERLNV
mmetsp:Transcript_346/g.745  ORF Transcript_346/g.745 Transcript_346/m.745 type:complete len:594 (+) Transcript_346:121-1902(+)